MRPKIGIIICGIQNNRQFVTCSYIEAIELAGGLPIVIPMSNKTCMEYLSFCNGFLFCGGEDINPLLYKQEPRQGLRETDLAFDLFQIRMIKAILKTKQPLLAICRGMQVLNVACGGSLIQDLKTNHMQKSDSRSDVFHSVSFYQSTIMHQVMGKKLYVNSYHHQAVDQPGHGLLVSGRSNDNVIEAIEMPSHPYVIGVQWHPECMFHISSKMRNLFHAFILHSI